MIDPYNPKCKSCGIELQGIEIVSDVVQSSHICARPGRTLWDT